MPTNGHDKTPLILVPPALVKTEPQLICHRFFTPIAVPEPDALRPNTFNITPRMGNFPCSKDKCTLWNAVAQECRDVTNSKSWETMAEYAYAMRNDSHIEGAN